MLYHCWMVSSEKSSQMPPFIQSSAALTCWHTNTVNIQEKECRNNVMLKGILEVQMRREWRKWSLRFKFQAKDQRSNGPTQNIRQFSTKIKGRVESWVVSGNDHLCVSRFSRIQVTTKVCHVEWWILKQMDLVSRTSRGWHGDPIFTPTGENFKQQQYNNQILWIAVKTSRRVLSCVCLDLYWHSKSKQKKTEFIL